jgi:glycosyltransferase involved in cell wall biosynthesis
MCGDLRGTSAHQMIAPEIGEAAMLFPTDDAAALADAIDAFRLDKGALARSRRAAWALGQDRFNWDVEARRLVGHFRFRAVRVEPLR